ncbi:MULTISPECIES: ornithine carbamoyltransferase [Oceanobacillus]|uniref:Ornithine carbamoyltransferase n=2 Tax=Oceanobacillus TaxID=182709 RepID=A0A0A1MRX3_9BACI|nr:ornithine carbamoyltransferase [Oceanobacillus oncorhynchi]MDM8100308.1 ornithine carbamoyltransferase [Oceanobacillus oncorhynchi]UUI40879.1 ornithine carbamoyltransferase [Oceanobacillus oncorhynchi]CEI82317.1 Ornithine carbamoyltransferase [Oceanobacillus oncorhynchi]
MTTNQIQFQQQELKGRDFLTLADYTKDEIDYLIELADYQKKQSKEGIIFEPLKGKTLGMIFEKASTRTRVSFETGIYQLGGLGIFLSSKDIQIGRGETIADTAQVLSGYLDGIMIRTYNQDDVVELAKYASIPVINGLTDLYHPCQVLADLQTIKEVKGVLQGQKLVYIGDGNNMAHSLMIGAAKMGMHIVTVTPDDYKPEEQVTEKAKQFASEHSATIEWSNDPAEAVKNADVVYTDVWASMGQEAEQTKREQDFQQFQVNEALLANAKADVTFMHCLPAHRGEEVSAGVIDGKHSVVFLQSENRLHAQKALMTALMG